MTAPNEKRKGARPGTVLMLFIMGVIIVHAGIQSIVLFLVNHIWPTWEHVAAVAIPGPVVIGLVVWYFALRLKKAEQIRFIKSQPQDIEIRKEFQELLLEIQMWQTQWSDNKSLFRQKVPLIRIKRIDRLFRLVGTACDHCMKAYESGHIKLADIWYIVALFRVNKLTSLTESIYGIKEQGS